MYVYPICGYSLVMMCSSCYQVVHCVIFLALSVCMVCLNSGRSRDLRGQRNLRVVCGLRFQSMSSRRRRRADGLLRTLLQGGQYIQYTLLLIHTTHNATNVSCNILSCIITHDYFFELFYLLGLTREKVPH